jgi:hypothetical protein
MKLVNENTDFYQQDTKFNNVIVTFTSPPVINLLSYNLILHDLTQPDPFHKLTEEEKALAFKKLSKDSAIRAFKAKVQTMSILSPSIPEDKMLMDL